MATENSKKQDFASVGTESFNLDSLEKKRQPVVINIQEEKTEGVLLEKAGTLNAGRLYKKINLFLLSFSKVKIQAKANFFHLLSVMINAGIPMVKALRSLAAQEKNAKMQMTVHSLADQIEGGKSLSSATETYPDIFIPQEVGMIRSGEASGQLNRVLENLSKDLEKAYSIKSKVKGAMLYPIVVFILLIAVVVAMMVFVVPKLTDLFTNNQLDLPLITKIVIAISDFMVNQKLILFLGVLILVVFFSFLRKTSFGRLAIDKFKINVPIFGKLFRKAYLSRFARSLSNLLDSNISIVKTIEIAGNSIGNEVYKRRLLLAAEDIKQGIPLAENLTDSPLFPPMLVNMVDVGEKTAQLDTIAGKVADFYEAEVDTAVASISKIIEPLVLILIGLAVGTIVASIMLPIMQLSEVAGVV